MRGKVIQFGNKGEGARSYYNRVLVSCESNGATFDVLQALVRCAEFKQNTVTMTRAQIAAESRRGAWAVKRALQYLKSVQIISAVRYGEGGRNCPTTYALRPAGEGVRQPINKAEGWGNDHPIWRAIAEELRAESLSRWENVFAVLKFFEWVEEEQALCVLAPNAHHALKVETKYAFYIQSAANRAGYPVKSIFVSY